MLSTDWCTLWSPLSPQLHVLLSLHGKWERGRKKEKLAWLVFKSQNPTHLHRLLLSLPRLFVPPPCSYLAGEGRPSQDNWENLASLLLPSVQEASGVSHHLPLPTYLLKLLIDGACPIIFIMPNVLRSGAFCTFFSPYDHFSTYFQDYNFLYTDWGKHKRIPMFIVFCLSQFLTCASGIKSESGQRVFHNYNYCQPQLQLNNNETLKAL